MKYRPILMSAPMVRAILSGAKTQTRRVVNPQPVDPYTDRALPKGARPVDLPACPYGAPGDRLWVRETWAFWDGGEHSRRNGGGVTFRADCLDSSGRERGDGLRARLDFGVKWRPSIFMPRWVSRITLEITDVRVERLQDISEADAIAEGVEYLPDVGGWRCYMNERGGYTYAVTSYRSLWESINGPGSWAANPWVWVIGYRRVTT